jgi:branched-chain amino acid transport system permease protein
VTHSWLAFALVAVLAITACGLLGFLIERLAYRPLRGQTAHQLAHHRDRHLAATGVRWASTKRSSDRRPSRSPSTCSPASGSPLFTSAAYRSAASEALVLFVTLASDGHASYIVLRTRHGLAPAAVSHRVDTASLMGINTNRIISFTFVLGSCLASTAGILYA